MTSEILFSGIQPSGNLHIGNYIGAIKQWIDLQDKYTTFISIADLHAVGTITSSDIRKGSREATLNTAATCIACGVEPQNIFIQSQIAEHTELMWIFSTLAKIGRLERMTQFKDKEAKAKGSAQLSLMSYPVLMAADILLYKAKIVPVGEDQVQHLELTRHLADLFNRSYDVEIFPMPEIKLGPTGCERIMNLQDGKKKMSKSDHENTHIGLTDTDEQILNKIMVSKTDSINDLTTDLEQRPETKNLLNLLSFLSSESIEKIGSTIKSHKELKETLADHVIKTVSPIKSKLLEIRENDHWLLQTLENGNERAKKMAKKTMAEVKELVYG